jgi:hypothetical protein
MVAGKGGWKRKRDTEKEKEKEKDEDEDEDEDEEKEEGAGGSSRRRSPSRRATVISPDKSAAQGSAFEESSRPGLAGSGVVAWGGAQRARGSTVEVSGRVRGSWLGVSGRVRGS